MKQSTQQIQIFILSSILFCIILFAMIHEDAQQKKIMALGKIIVWQDEVIEEMYHKMDNYTELILMRYVDQESGE